ncbi:MAG TPA: hypothetical protein VMU43_14735 [Candidatus Acidoferrum sp.]|nr:hypothetical protein [Candidatus Acidoferrum sp.]
MAETVFIIGAGVSKQAGAPLMNDFLDRADQLRKRWTQRNEDFDLVFRGRDALQAAQSKATIELVSIESVFAAFEMAGLLGELGSLNSKEIESLPAAMVQVIQRTLEESISFPFTDNQIKPVQPYGTIASIVVRSTDRVNSHRVAFITFNYDLCLDYALHSNVMRPNYCLTDNESGIKLLKLHGSLNWARCPDCNKIVAWNLSDFFKQFVGPDFSSINLIKLKIAENLSKYRHCANNAPRVPFIAPPTWNKTMYHKELENVWRAAARELSDAENIIICGYSLPDTDEFFRYLYALGSIGGAGLKRFWVINPDPSVVPRFRALCGQQANARFRHLNMTVEQALGEIERVLIPA